MVSLQDFFSQKINKRVEEASLRQLKTTAGLIDFSSNDYLGLARSEVLFDMIQKKAESLQPAWNGSTGSRLLSGNSLHTEALENKLATFLKSESALLFNSGYAANQAVLSSIPQKNDTILYDELVHACIKDGARLSLATRHSFKHNDLEDLENKIKRSKHGRIFIAVESIYSMDGDECPLIEIIKLSEKYNASIVIDEAHSTGIMGDHGNGMACSLNLENKIDIRIHTFGKAMGVHGACVVGSPDLIQYLINFARPFIYTTALPPHSVTAIDCALDFLTKNINLQTDLKHKVNLFLNSLNITNRTLSSSAIQTAIFRGNDNVKNISYALQEKGFDARPILSPTVPKDSERLRICLHAYNTDEEILRLTKELNSKA